MREAMSSCKATELKRFLISRGSGSQPHGDRTLLQHLEGVHRILVAANSDEAVCHAGLFHSVYGTFVYQAKLLAQDQREVVQGLIGLRAEELVWAFCSIPRPKILEMSLASGTHQWIAHAAQCRHSTHEQLWLDLLRIECANMLEQRSLHGFPFLGRHAAEIGMVDAEGFCV